MRRELTRLRVSLALLTERRAALYIAIDVILLFAGLVTAFNGDGIAAVFYASLYVMPLFLVAVPMMSEAVAIERRSGTLDLALTSPGSMNYFERRIASVALLAMLQGWLTLSIPYFMVEHFPLSGPMLQMLIVTLFVASAVLMWSVRLRSAGAVALMTYVTCAAFAPWFFSIRSGRSTPIMGPCSLPTTSTTSAATSSSAPVQSSSISTRSSGSRARNHS